MLSAKLSKEAVEKRLAKIVKGLKRPAPFLKSWAHAVARLAKRNARARSKGGSFWIEIADQTKVTKANNREALVECLHFAGKHKHTGGIIRAKSAQALTIPIAMEAKGKRASEFLATGRKLFVPKGSDVLGYSEDGNFVGLFLLRKSVDQDAEPWWPGKEEALKLGLKEAQWWLKKQVGK